MMSAPRVVLLMVPFAGFDRGLLEGIARYSQLHGPWEFYLSGDDPAVAMPSSDSLSGQFAAFRFARRSLEVTVLPNLQAERVTGVIGRIQSSRIANRILAAKLPLIGIDWSKEQLEAGNPLSRIPEVRADSHHAGRLAAEHFLERGFRHFAFCGFAGRVWSDRRFEGFRERLVEAGLDSAIYEPPEVRRGLSWKKEEPRIVRWLQSLPKPTAVMACNDIRGRQVLDACRTAGLRVPDDTAVIGVDDDLLICSLSSPPLSSVAFNLEKAGYQAAERLDELMNGRKSAPDSILIEAQWVVARQSTDVAAVEDRELAGALRFIREQSRRPIAVADVVAQTSRSRRGLEIRFQQLLGRSIRQEIERTRLAHARRLLAETTLPGQRIAELTGFGSPAYLSNVFRREAGTTLERYRRQSRTP